MAVLNKKIFILLPNFQPIGYWLKLGVKILFNVREFFFINLVKARTLLNQSQEFRALRYWIWSNHKSLVEVN